MGLLENTDWNGVSLARPVIRKGAVPAVVREIREEESPTKSGTPRTNFFVQLETTTPQLDLDGRDIAPGFRFTARIQVLTGSGLTDGQRKSAEINQRIVKAFMCAGLGVAKTTENVAQLVAQAGGWPALVGRPVVAMVDTEPDQDDPTTLYQRVVGFAKPAA